MIVIDSLTHQAPPSEASPVIDEFIDRLSLVANDNRRWRSMGYAEVYFIYKPTLLVLSNFQY